MNRGTLHVWMSGRHAATLTRSDGKMQLRYDPEWRFDVDATPLSLSMPLTSATHDHPVVEPWITGLLPDNDRTVARWARQMQVGVHPFALLSSTIGLDCAGAVQFTPTDSPPDVGGTVVWLTDDEVADALQGVLAADGASRPLGDAGYFSLGGAQPKLALTLDPTRGWGRPVGAMATTHILKPHTGEFDAFTINEHVCLRAMAGIGLPAAESRLLTFGDIPTLVSVRYDRTVGPGRTIRRVHQEDTCQALGASPDRKYQADGGPGLAAIGQLLTTVGDVGGPARLFDVAVCSWLLAATDVHAKNLSVLLDRDAVTLAPVYDVASAAPYFHRRELKLAMKVGHYHIHKIAGRHFTRLADNLGLDPATAAERAAWLAEHLAVALLAAFDALAGQVPSATIDGLAAPIAANLVACRRVLND